MTPLPSAPTEDADPAATTAPPSTPPTVPGHWLLGSLRAFRDEGLEFYRRVHDDHGDVAIVRFGPTDVYTFFHPDAIRHVLQGNHTAYRREPFTNRIFKQLTGENVFTADGSEWLRRRRLIQPAFHRARIARFADLMVAETTRAIEDWRAAEGPIDMLDAYRRLTMVIVGRALFSVDFTREAHQLGRAFVTSASYFAWRTQQPFALPLWFPTPRNREARTARQRIRGRMQRMLDERRASATTGDDLMGMLMELRDEDGEPMPDADLVSELTVMFGAGHETTTAALAWATWLTSTHPDVEQRLLDEIDTVLGQRLPTADDLESLHWTRAIIDEALRLYPPAWIISRQAAEDDTVDGMAIPAGAGVSLVAFFAHRDPRFWDQPEQFDPSRWIDGRVPEPRTAAYFPFGAGPRKCIGDQFALTEMVLVLATLYGRLRPRVHGSARIEMDNGFTLRPKHGVPMELPAR